MSGPPERREWIVLKLGGSLITDKGRPETPRPEIIERLAREIAALKAETDAGIVVGHGSGSFGHAAAHRHGVRGPLETEEQRRGAAVTQLHAARLHRMVVEALAGAGAQPASIAPSASVIAEAGVPVTFPHEAVRRTLALGWTPVLYGDVVPDRRWGAAICSTEILLKTLLLSSERESPVRAVYWLGVTAGIYDPAGETIPEIRPDNLDTVRAAIGETAGTDVTGGMGLRLDTAWALAKGGIASWILDGREPGILFQTIQTVQTVRTVRTVRTARVAEDSPITGTFLPAHP